MKLTADERCCLRHNANFWQLIQKYEIDVAKLTDGMRAQVTVDAFPNDKFTGHIKRIAPTSVESQPGQANSDAVVKYEVELRLDTNDKRLRSGLSAKCTLDVVRRTGVVLVSKAFVSKDAKGHFVNLAPTTKEGKPTRKEIKVGAESGAQFEVISGVNVGDKLVEPAFTGPTRKGMMQMGPDDQ